MAMDFNVEPYYDDFNPSKHFHKILFKPGYSVQTRELNQLQSIIDAQIDRLGSHVFKEGSGVHDGQHSTLAVTAYEVSSFTGTLNIKYFQDAIVYVGGVQKLVVYIESIQGKNYIFTRDKTSGVFANPSILSVLGDVTTSITVTSSSSSVLHQIKKGIYFVRGAFVQVEPQSIVVSLGNPKVSSDVYLVATESIVESTSDESLLDNSFGTPNYSAPGADRYAIDLSLATTLPGSPLLTSSKNFLLVSYREGVIVNDVNKPQYSDLEVHLADRTFKESGNYTVNAFYGKSIPDLTDTTNTLFKVDAGIAFINGYEFKTEAPTLLSVPKARTTDIMNNGQIQIDKGPYVVVENVKGFISPYDRLTVEIHNSTTVSTNSVTYLTTLMGTATCTGLIFDSLNSGNSNTYKLFLSDIALALGKNIADARSFVIKAGSGTYTWSFYADYSSETYDSLTITGAAGPKIVIPYNTLNYSNIFTLANAPIKTHINALTSVNDISYQYYKAFLGHSFERGTGGTIGTFSVSGSQFFIGAGILSSSTTVAQWYGVVKSIGSGTGTAPAVGAVIKMQTATVNILDTSNASLTLPYDWTLTLDIFVVISETATTTRNKIVHSNTDLVVTTSLSAPSISLGKADCTSLVSVIGNDLVDYTSLYSFYDGQTDLYYDHSSIVLKNAKMSPVTKNAELTSLTIKYNYYEHTGIGPFTVDSYSGISLDRMPNYQLSNGTKIRLSDAIDFRPKRTDGASTLVFDNFKRPSFGSAFSTDYEYYLPRIDLVVVTQDLSLSIVSGIAAKYPTVPDPGTSMTVYTLTIPAYTFNIEDIIAEFVSNKGYTMKDIAKIDNRVTRLEYYTALSLLEKQAADESVPSSVPLIDKFKNGILVDPFAGHSVGDVYNSAYNCAIDFSKRYLRPAFNSSSFRYIPDSSTNATVSDDLVTLHYSELPVITQTVASEDESVQPFAIFNWNGIMTLDPPSDTWVDTQTRPESIVNMNGANDAYSVFSQGNGQAWSDWATTGVGATNLNLSSTLNVTTKTTLTV